MNESSKKSETVPQVHRSWSSEDNSGVRLSDVEVERIEDVIEHLSSVDGVRFASQAGGHPLREIHVQQLTSASPDKLFSAAHEHRYVATGTDGTFGWSGSVEDFVTNTDFGEHHERDGDDVVTWVFHPVEHTELNPEYDRQVLKERAEAE